jgi:hypothetical protein
MIVLEAKKLTETGYVTEKPALYAGFRIGTDSVNDPEITVSDGEEGEEVEPTATYDASQLGLNGASEGGHVIYCESGIYVTIACEGDVEVSVRFINAEDFSDGSCKGRRFGF